MKVRPDISRSSQRQFLTLFSATSHLIHDLLTLFLITQSRVVNIPIFLLFQFLFLLLRNLNLPPNEITFLSVLLQHTSFFAFGGSNAISTIDLSNAYNGVDNYAVTIVGVLTFCSNWAGPLWWTSATILLMLRKQGHERRELWFRHLSVLTVLNATSNFAVMLACTVLRSHLFVWTVFSPKYLYSIAWSVGQHFCIDVVCGSLLFWIGCL